MIKTLKFIVIFLLLSLLVSCTGYKKLPYLKEADTLTEEDFKRVTGFYEGKIMPKDVIYIYVSTPTPGAASDFNLPLIPNNYMETLPTTPSPSSAGSVQNYVVDSDGYITFPVIGKIRVGGLTKAQTSQLIEEQIYPKYLKEKPSINIRFLTFKISVLGEVARPGIYESKDEQMTIFDALAMAGDATIYGKRQNVMLIRKNEKGITEVHRINLQDKSLLLNNELYYLQQNDKIYIETNKTKGNNSQIGSFETLSLSAISIVISIVGILLR